MNDTSPEASARLTRLIEARSGSDRVRMTCEMFDLARALVIANLRARHPAISNSELRLKIFERLYGNDLVTEDRCRLIERLKDGRDERNGQAASVRCK